MHASFSLLTILYQYWCGAIDRLEDLSLKWPVLCWVLQLGP